MRQHLQLRGYDPVVPTVRMLRLWWGRLNAEVFDNALLPPTITFGPSQDVHGAVFGLCYALPAGRVRIHLDPRCDTRGRMLSTLAHEMVHQYQHQHGSAMTHGPSFRRWIKPIEKRTSLEI